MILTKTWKFRLSLFLLDIMSLDCDNPKVFSLEFSNATEQTHYPTQLSLKSFRLPKDKRTEFLQCLHQQSNLISFSLWLFFFFNDSENLIIWLFCVQPFFRYYNSLPPVSKTYGVACLMTTAAFYLQLYNPWNIALKYEDVIKRFQVNSLVSNLWIS